MRHDGIDGINKRTLSEEAYEVIKRRIVELRLPPGVPITESALAADLGLSKTPIRDALARLEREGLVTLTHRCGYRVSSVTLKDVGDSFAMRILLEGEAAELAAKRSLRAEVVQQLQDMAGISDLMPNHESANPRTNIVFHLGVAQASGNDRLVRALEGLLDHVERMVLLALSINPEAGLMVAPGHAEIVQAVLGGDPGRARACAMDHAHAAQYIVTETLVMSDSLQSANVAAGTFSPRGNLRTAETADLR